MLHVNKTFFFALYFIMDVAKKEADKVVLFTFMSMYKFDHRFLNVYQKHISQHLYTAHNFSLEKCKMCSNSNCTLNSFSRNKN